MRTTLKSVNEALAGLGAQTRLMKGDGYFYFDSGEAENWLDKTISTPTLSSRTVDEWVQDICHHNYNGAPTDGSAWESGQDGRVARGGAWAWFDHPSLFRAASHVCGVGAGPMVGFRVARDDR